MFEKHKQIIALWAVQECNLEVLREALESGVDPDEKIKEGSEKGKSLMEVAVFEGEGVVVEMLLEYGGDPDGKTKDGKKFKKIADEEILGLLNKYSA